MPGFHRLGLSSTEFFFFLLSGQGVKLQGSEQVQEEESQTFSYLVRGVKQCKAGEQVQEEKSQASEHKRSAKEEDRPNRKYEGCRKRLFAFPKRFFFWAPFLGSEKESLGFFTGKGLLRASLGLLFRLLEGVPLRAPFWAPEKGSLRALRSPSEVHTNSPVVRPACTC